MEPPGEGEMPRTSTDHHPARGEAVTLFSLNAQTEVLDWDGVSIGCVQGFTELRPAAWGSHCTVGLWKAPSLPVTLLSLSSEVSCLEAANWPLADQLESLQVIFKKLSTHVTLQILFSVPTYFFCCCLYLRPTDLVSSCWPPLIYISHILPRGKKNYII